jgi:hypothetical protein
MHDLAAARARSAICGAVDMVDALSWSTSSLVIESANISEAQVQYLVT